MTIGALIFAAAAGFAIAGAYLWLSTQIPNHLAALAVAGGLFLVGAFAIAVGLLRNGSPTPKPDTSVPAPEDSAEIISHSMMQAALAEVARTPVKATLAAVALGVIVGLLRSRKTP
ncbi:MAG: hypothetical protein RIM72_13280 [Alphaproteobacteria bacterium]